MNIAAQTGAEQGGCCPQLEMGTPGIMVNQSRRQPFSSSGSGAGQCCKATYKGSYYDSTSYMLKEIHPIADHIISGQLLVSVLFTYLKTIILTATYFNTLRR